MSLDEPDAAAMGEDPRAANRRTVARFFADGWGANAGWEAVWREIVAPDVSVRFHAVPGPIVGLDAAIAFNAGLFQGFPRLAVTVTGVIAEGDGVAVHSRVSGQHSGPFLGIPASGARVDVPDVTLFRLSDGQIVEWFYMTDLLWVLATIGALEMPVPLRRVYDA